VAILSHIWPVVRDCEKPQAFPLASESRGSGTFPERTASASSTTADATNSRGVLSSSSPPKLGLLLPQGDLVDDEPEDRMGAVVADAGGDEVAEVRVDEGDGEGAVDDFAVDLRRKQPCRRRVGGVQGVRALDLAVESGVAEPAVAGRVRGGAAEVFGKKSSGSAPLPPITRSPPTPSRRR
jgi:hypothetical protein